MDRARFSDIAHGDMPLWNPIPLEVLEEMLARIPGLAGAAFLDIGCGRGALLQAAARRGARGLGVDVSETAIARARAAVAAVDWRCGAYRPGDFASGSFAVAACVGSIHALGDSADALAEIFRVLAPGGHALYGDGYWKREPAEEYLAFLEARRSDLALLDEHRARIRGAGFSIVASAVASDDDWDRYEGGYAANVEAFTAAHPDDPDTPAMLERIRRWSGGYHRWGRAALGFALSLLRKPA